MLISYTDVMRISGIAVVTLASALILAFAGPRDAGALTPLQFAQPTGLSVEAKSRYGGGFDFQFRSDNSTATVSIDPLGSQHTSMATLSSKDGSISLSGRFERFDRTIRITANRGGKQIGEYSWRVEAVLR